MAKVDEKTVSRSDGSLPSETSTLALLVLFVVLAASRDTGTELFLKKWGKVPPDVILLGFCFSALLLAAALSVRRERNATNVISKEATPLCIGLALTTLSSYTFTVLAIQSQLGAAYHSFIDYGASPAITVIIAALWLGETPSGRYVAGLALALGGVLLFTGVAAHEPNGSIPAALGAVFSLCAATSGAFVFSINKRLLNMGCSPRALLAVRMGPLTLILAVVVYVCGHLPVLARQPVLLLFCVLFFAVPLYLNLVALKRMRVQRFAGWLFLIPCTTYIQSMLWGLKAPGIGPILAVGLTIAALLVMESNKQVKGS
jgi:drug/metabolite transporter (DMT)-like permease